MIDAIGGLCVVIGLVLLFSALPLLVVWRRGKQSRTLNIILTLAVIAVNAALIFGVLTAVRMCYLRVFYRSNLNQYFNAAQTLDDGRLLELTRALKEQPLRPLPQQFLHPR